MGFTYGKDELIGDLQQVFARHNVQSVRVKEPGTLFRVESDGSLTIGIGATITSFERQPDEKQAPTLKVINGKKK
ncbi:MULTISPECIES: hypothetical protein [Halobacillus]|uniref:Uncharacterized protein n=1 Tax=Halobacillus faecis TaxID=360184 RepID=A0A511WNS9_9BACI|nr:MULTISPECIES: hypothetical protein [Halobacillus]MBX0357012.1 hypothetical protein [Halobacillus sp. Nhm2S1]GEN52800.1 hypothetical protein HFA01_10620 [Halobacillus faecis]